MMFIKTLLLLMAANVLLAGHIRRPENRIIGGTTIDIETAPWQVFVLRRRNETDFGFGCGGSLIRPDIVLTAGHCVISSPDRNEPAIITVRVGSSNKNEGGEVINVANFKKHEYIYINANRSLFLNDIAVLLLEKPVSTSPSVQIIDLASNLPPVGTQGFVSGWGNITDYFGQPTIIPSILHGTFVTILPQSSCIKLSWFNSGNICAGRMGTTTCAGDSGGALVVNNQVVGVVSAGSNKCDTATTYAGVPLYHEWILNAIDKLYL